MIGDMCTIHKDRIAVGYYGDASFGNNGCKECMERHKGSLYWVMYDKRQLLAKHI